MDEAVRLKESLVNEVKCLREELQRVREDRDRRVSEVQALTTDLLKFKEKTGQSFMELDRLTIKSNALQVFGKPRFFFGCIPFLEKKLM